MVIVECWFFGVAVFVFFFFFKQKTAYEMRISVWSSDVCSSDRALHFWLPAVEPMPRLARITYNASAIFGGTVIVLQMARLLASGKPVLFSSLYQIVERIIWLLCFLSLIDSGANLVEGLILSMVQIVRAHV